MSSSGTISAAADGTVPAVSGQETPGFNGLVRTAMRATEKIRPLEDLAEICAEARQNSEVVVLAHGVFDLLHMGHVRHLEAALREGTMLIVTITADEFVNKGPGRPVFPEHMRAEMLAALQYVDFVGINYGPSAEPVIRLLKPSIYVKGSEYESLDEDVTGKIKSEKCAVEEYGGRLLCTRDITFSSSSLINRYFNIYDPRLRQFLDRVRTDVGLDRLLNLVDSIRDFRVLFVGDTIIDEYQFVQPMNKPAKEHIIAAKYDGREVYAGGVIAAANHLATFCREVEIITTLGTEDSHEELVRKSLHPNVRLIVVHRDKTPTTRKLRFVDPSYMRKMFEVYFFDDSPYGQAITATVASHIAERAPKADVVVVTDFGHGFVVPSLIPLLRETSKFLAINAQTNAGNQGYNLITKYPAADYICVDEPEARLAVADKYSDVIDIAEQHLPARIACDKFIITNGKHGCISFDKRRGSAACIPAFTSTIVDTVGAGDAFLAVTAPLVRAGGDIDHVGFIGNAAGAIKVGIVGHRRSVEKPSSRPWSRAETFGWLMPSSLPAAASVVRRSHDPAPTATEGLVTRNQGYAATNRLAQLGWLVG